MRRWVIRLLGRGKLELSKNYVNMDEFMRKLVSRPNKHDGSVAYSW